MFKDRIKDSFVNILATIGAVLVIILAMTLITVTVVYVPFIVEIIAWGFGAFMALGILIVVVYYIHWQFIEPFKNYKKNKSN